MAGPSREIVAKHRRLLRELWDAMDRGEDTDAMAAELKAFMVEHRLGNEAPVEDTPFGLDTETGDRNLGAA